MNEELFKLFIGVVVVVIIAISFYIRSGRRKSFYSFILSSLMNFWDKVVKLLVLIAIVWVSVRVAAHFLRGIF